MYVCVTSNNAYNTIFSRCDRHTGSNPNLIHPSAFPLRSVPMTADMSYSFPYILTIQLDRSLFQLGATLKVTTVAADLKTSTETHILPTSFYRLNQTKHRKSGITLSSKLVS